MNIILKNRNFFLLWSGQSISGLGTWINFVGLNAYIYHITGSGAILGSFLLIRILPALIFGSLGGILADRLCKRKIMIFCDLLRAVLVLSFLFTKDIFLFFLIGFILSALDKIFMASNGAILPDLVKKEDVLSANSINRMTNSIITVLGPAVGGALIGFCGYKTVFVIDSLSFFVSVATLIFMKKQGSLELKESEKTDIIAEMKSTFKFLSGSSILLSFTFLRFLDGLGSGSYNTVLPVFASKINILGGSYYGYLIAFWGLGTFLGSLSTGFLKTKINISTKNLFCGAMIVMALGMGLTFNFNIAVISLISIFLGGIGDGISSVIFNTILMKAPPKELRGKVFGTISSFLYMVVGIGMLIAGFFIDFVKYVLITNGGTVTIITGTVFVWCITRKEKIEEI